jgi:hypothetical protein
LAKSLGGQKVTFEVAGAESTVKLAPIFKVSLRTKDGGEARLRRQFRPNCKNAGPLRGMALSP